MARLFLTQSGNLRIDERHDAKTAAEQTLRSAGVTATQWVVRPSFEGPFFSRLDELSAALVRSWMRALSVGTFYQVDGGMDSPWRHLGERLGVRTGATVERVAPMAGGVEIVVDGVAESYDGAVVAVPAPVAARIVAPEALPAAVADIEYAPHVRLYLARQGVGPPRSGIHAFPNETVATVELGAGGDGSWGRVPTGWEWALLCAPAASSGRLLELPDDELAAELWEAGSKIDSRLFPLEYGGDRARRPLETCGPEGGGRLLRADPTDPAASADRVRRGLAGAAMCRGCGPIRERRGGRVRVAQGIDSRAWRSTSAPADLDRLTALMTAQLPAYLADLQRLVDIDCGSYTKAGVDEVGRWVAATFRDLGAAVEVLPNEAHGDTVVGTFGGADAPRRQDRRCCWSVTWTRCSIRARSRSGRSRSRTASRRARVSRT